MLEKEIVEVYFLQKLILPDGRRETRCRTSISVRKKNWSLQGNITKKEKITEHKKYQIKIKQRPNKSINITNGRN